MDLHYNAFISYKHAPADIAVAKEVQHRLEHYRVPKAVRKQTGRERIERIFRDQEELPITSDLSKDIDAALQDAEFLIVICSTSTKLSTWVPREIARFLEFHDRNHILTVLVDGEPNEVIPKILLEETTVGTDENGNVTEQKRIFEPLSCDYRGNLRQARKTEIPRLAAALLGCRYDELVMRERQYKLKRLTAMAAVGGVLALGAITYLIWSNRQIQSNYERAEENRILAETNYQKAEENRQLAEENYQKAEENYEEAQANLLQARRNQITFLANESLDAMGHEEYMLAVQLAMAALPGEGREDWPRMALPEYALSRAVSAYTPYYAGSSYHAVWDMEMQGNILDFTVQRAKNLLYAYDYYGNVTGWDLAGYRELFRTKPGSKTSAMDVNDIFVLDHNEVTDLIVESDTAVCLLDGMNGETKWSFNGSELLGQVVSRTVRILEGEIFVFVGGYRTVLSEGYEIVLCCLDPESGQIVWQSQSLQTSMDYDVFCVVSEDQKELYFCLEYKNSSALYGCDLTNGQIREIPTEIKFQYLAHLFEPAGGQIVLYGVTEEEEHTGSSAFQGTVLLAPWNATLLCLDTESGKTVWKSGFSSTDMQYLNDKRSCWIMNHKDPQGQMRSLLMIVYGQTVRFFDRSDGSLYEEYMLDSPLVSVNTAVDGSMFLSVLQNGNLITYELDRDDQYSMKRFQTDTAYQAVLCFPHNNWTAFVIKTDRTRLQLFEMTYDDGRNDFKKTEGYKQHFSEGTLCQDRWLAVALQNSTGGPWTVDLYDLESKERSFHLNRTFSGSRVTALGTDVSGRFLVLSQTYPHQILVFDTQVSGPSQEPVCCFEVENETGLRFVECRMVNGRVCLLQHRYNWDKSEVRLLFLDLQPDGSLKAAESASVPLDPETNYYTQFAGSDDGNRYLMMMQYFGLDEEEKPVLHLYDLTTGEWLRPDFEAETTQSSKAGMDYLPSQALLALTDGKKMQVFNEEGRVLYTISDPARTVEAIQFCPAVGCGLEEDLLLVVNRDEKYRMDRYRASDGTFLGSCDILYYSQDVTRSRWRFTEGELILQLDDVIVFVNTEEWIMTAAAMQCLAYSVSERTVVSLEYMKDFRPVWYPRYTLEELLEKGKEFLKGAEMSESVRSVYGISE